MFPVFGIMAEKSTWPETKGDLISQYGGELTVGKLSM
jgi:hypothetical protein